MKLIDSKGRLFGKINILDLGAIAVIILVLIGIFIVPGPTGSVAQVGNNATDEIEVSLLARGLKVKDSQALISQLNNNDKVDVIVRNEPAGNLTVKSAEQIINHVAVPQPDGTVKSLPDPRPEVAYSMDLILTMVGKGSMTDDGAVLAGEKVKIGTTLDLDGKNYNFRGSIIDVRQIN